MEDPTAFQKFLDQVISLTVKKWHEKRSLDANAYFHVLKDKMAEVHGISPMEMHNILLCKYGETDTEMPHVFLRDDIDFIAMKDLHLRPVEGAWDPVAQTMEYEIVRGTHTYDKAEMAKFLNFVVIDAESIGIETRTPDEIARMVSLVPQAKK